MEMYNILIQCRHLYNELKVIIILGKYNRDYISTSERKKQDDRN